MALPTFDADLHDIGIDGKGFLRADAGEGAIQRQDMQPATSRAAEGEGRYDSFQSESFRAQATWEGGVGQGRFRAADQFLTGITDTRFAAHAFPARKIVATGSVGGGTTGYFTREGVLYGMLSTTLEKVSDGSEYTNALPPRDGSHPVTTAAGNVLWVSSSKTLLKWSGTGAATDISSGLGTNVTPYAIDLYGRFLWCIGKRRVTTGGVLVQTRHLGFVSSAVFNFGFVNVPKPTSVLALFIASEDTTPFNAVSSLPAGWSVRSVSNATNITMTCITKENPTAADRVVSVVMDSSAIYWVLGVEIDGLNVLSPYLSVAETNHTTANYTSGTVSASAGFNLFVVAEMNDLATSTTPANYTSVFDGDAGSISWHAYYRADTTDTQVAVTATNETEAAGIIIKFDATPIGDNFDKTVFFYSNDDGTTWNEVFSGDSAGMPLPIATLATQGSLWITTDRGLYEARSEEREFEDHTTNVLLAARGPVDIFSYPLDASAIGNQLTTWEGALYYNLGGTIRRFAPGGVASQIWPNPAWATTGGTIKAMVAGEGGVYFSAGGYLWNYNGRGVHQLAKEVSSGDFDVLFWHGGKLYCKGDPAKYLDFGFPSLRPDLSSTSPAAFTTGYLISSEVDFDKVPVVKVVRAFELQGYFTAGTTAVESGTLTLEYALGCDGVVDPGKEGGAAAATTWVSIGSMSVVDGGTKAFTLATPLQCKRLFLRVTITPGTVGYPVLLAYTAYGRAVMPSTVRIVAPISIYTGQTDKAASVVYADDADVKAAVDHLRTLRRGTNATKYFTVSFVDEIGGVEEYVCTAETMADWLTWQKRDNGLGALVQFAAAELPS